MPKEFKFADLGEGITEGEIVKWFVQEGSAVTVDQTLLEVETDKAIVPISSPFTGIIKAIHGKEGEIIKVGDVLVEFSDERLKKDFGSVVGILEEAPEDLEEARPDPGVIEKSRAIPSVRVLARSIGVDLNRVKGTGPEGRIRKEDVLAYSSASEVESKRLAPHAAPGGKPESGGIEIEVVRPPDSVERIPFKGIRRTAARLVVDSVQKIPHVTFMDKADMTRLQEVREQEKTAIEKQGLKLTYLPFIIKSVIAGLKLYPYLNSSLDEGRQEIILKKYYHIGIAVDTPNGLMVFALKNADQKSILEIARELNDLGQKAVSRTIDLKDLKGSTFTITNYGVIGGTYGTPIINYPEAAILGVGKIEDQAVVINGKIVIRKIAPLSLAFDHRLIDGADAGRFLNAVIEHIQNPNLLLIESR
ncbi:MAG: 2-oxo acid dehydrogenase subunit E2 [Nitrospirae bacterium]|nr:2-oxo acid dehydrogenase subunit E2 [Nitrospirota bacterium]MBI3351705.1 2-oxo acid dehydrogenase subunit E2 [Nitrospirota bacterium]